MVGACFVALVALMGWSTPARADDPAILFDTSVDLLAQARQLYIDGLNARRAHQWDRARVFFLSAWRAQRHWQIAANLANAEIMLGRYRDAAEHAAIFMHDTRDLQDIDVHQRATVEQVLASARAKVGVVTVTAPPGAEVRINGSSVGKAPLDLPVYVEPGRTVVEARLDGYQSSLESRELAPGGEAKVELRLVPVPVLPELQGGAPVVRREAPPGPAPDKKKRTAAIVTGSVLAGGGLIAGAVLAVVASAKASDASTKLKTLKTGTDPCHMHAGTCSAIDSDLGWHDRLSNASMGVFIGAGAVGLATLGYALFAAPRQPIASGMRVLPTVGAGQGGFVVTGAW